VGGGDGLAGAPRERVQGPHLVVEFLAQGREAVGQPRCLLRLLQGGLDAGSEHRLTVGPRTPLLATTTAEPAPQRGEEPRRGDVGEGAALAAAEVLQALVEGPSVGGQRPHLGDEGGRTTTRLVDDVDALARGGEGGFVGHDRRSRTQMAAARTSMSAATARRRRPAPDSGAPSGGRG
jgi:hypothetical protein